MKSTWSTCSFLLLTMAAVSEGRNAADYFQQARFQYSPSRPEDALVLFIANAPSIICEPDTSDECYGGNYEKGDFCLSLPQEFSRYKCSIEGSGSRDRNMKLIGNVLPGFDVVNGRWIREFRKDNMFCTTNSKLPDEYFHVSVQRPHEDHLVKCHFLTDNGTFHLRFPGYPTISCYIGNKASRYSFSLSVVDDPFTCAFRVYSELPLGDTHTEKRLYESLVSGLPTPMDGTRLRLWCSRHAASNGTANFQLQLSSGTTYDCTFPDTTPRNQPQSQHMPQE